MGAKSVDAMIRSTVFSASLFALPVSSQPFSESLEKFAQETLTSVGTMNSLAPPSGNASFYDDFNNLYSAKLYDTNFDGCSDAAVIYKILDRGVPAPLGDANPMIPYAVTVNALFGSQPTRYNFISDKDGKFLYQGTKFSLQTTEQLVDLTCKKEEPLPHLPSGHIRS